MVRYKQLKILPKHIDELRSILERNPYCTLNKLGKQFGVTGERIRQVLKEHHITKKRSSPIRSSSAHSTATFTRAYTPRVTNRRLTQESYVRVDSPRIPIDIFDSTSLNFVGLEASKIHAPSVRIYNPFTPAPKLFNDRSKCKKHISLCFKGHRWRCYICNPLYGYDYIGEDGSIRKEEETKPCHTCGKPVTRRAAILRRIYEDSKYKNGVFYCNRECFHSRPEELITCVVCNTEFKSQYARSMRCSSECREVSLNNRKDSRNKKRRLLKKSQILVDFYSTTI